MSFTHVLAVAPVMAIEPAVEWYERLLGRPADARPMDGLADWHISPYAWLQVFQSPEQAGGSLVNLVSTTWTGPSRTSKGGGSRPGRPSRGRLGCGSPPSTTPTATGSP